MISDTNIDATNAAENVVTEKPFITVPRYQNINPLTTTENNPRVRILIGNVSMCITGLRNMLNSVRHAPTISATHTGSTATPPPNIFILVVSQTATESINQCAIILIQKNKIILINHRQQPSQHHHLLCLLNPS